MTLLKDIVYYFAVYKRYLGVRLYIVFILTILAAATEGLGITLLLPLISLIGMDGGMPEASGLKLVLQNVLDFIGIGESIVGILIFIGLVFFVKGIFKFAEGGYKHYLQAQLMREIKIKMFNYYGGMDYRYYSTHNTGHFINIIDNQINEFIVSFEKYKLFVSALITATAYLVFAFLINWKFAGMAVVVGLIILLLFKRLNVYVRKLSRKTARERGRLSKFLVQTMQSFKYISSTAQMPYFKQSVMESISRITSNMRNQGFADAFTRAVKEPISIFFILSIIIVQLVVLDAQLAPIFVALILVHRAINHIVSIQSAWQVTMSKIGSLEMVENEFHELAQHQEPKGLHELARLQDSIQLSDVRFSYNGSGTNVLKNVNLSIKANTTVAFVGESGTGKTTLVDILTLMLKPDRGTLLIDGIPSHTIDPGSWRKQIGYVSQDTVVFDDTIANNICLWQGDYNSDPELRKRIERAAGKASARSFIDRMPDGFNTIVGDRGIRLSGGQRQRLFIARELFKNPPFLILDEATSALDSESEQFIRESINRLRGSTTVILISHRLSTIKDADYIYVLDNGAITEHGTYNDLVSSNGKHFTRMVELQSL